MEANNLNETLFNEAKSKGIKYIHLQFTDLYGSFRTITTTIEHLEKNMSDGIGLDGSSIKGFTNIEDSDLLLFPIADTFKQLPWNERGARVTCEIMRTNGEHFEGDPRYKLREFLERVRKDFGFEYFVGPEIEFFILNGQRPADNANYYASLSTDKYADLRLEIGDNIRHFDIIPECFHHEVAPGQHEINIRYDNALDMADKIQIHKFVIRHIASKHDLIATFMPKPFKKENGSGMHVHQSLFNINTGKNVFGDETGLSEIGQYFTGGLLKYAKLITAITSPTVNSYKRLVPGFEAPVYIAWDYGNRSTLIRVPKYSTKSCNTIRIEYRSPDPLSNPYLVFLVMLAAGIQGIKERIEPPERISKNIYHLTEHERKQSNIDTLPGSLEEAVNEFKKATFLKNTLGVRLYDSLTTVMMKEWESYASAVQEPYSKDITDWEYEHYLYM